MQQFILKNRAAFISLTCLLLTSFTVFAQEKVKIDTDEIGTWFERNWIWVAAGVLLIIIIAALARNRHSVSGGKRRTTTVVEDAAGNTKSVTTTEENL